ncbi:HD-GYP domain-containing protein [uncultured Deinococcus sp.]|uniref:HD-GYP domain-containing protein n=1 Tax=uncultured Deinococcus sp. TaxID=158789 RepID=UPI0025908594|nr:HD-GYP domain-containing protein [uncultured Deinococcus sp.]
MDASASPDGPQEAAALPLPDSAVTPNDLALHLTRLALTAPDLGSAMTPVLDTLVGHTAAVGAGYFQWREATLAYHARSASGEMPEGPQMAALLAHGLPGNMPLLRALERAEGVLYFEETQDCEIAAGFPDLGVRALLAAPVTSQSGELVGALLAHVFTPHVWTPAERQLVGSVTGLLALLAARLDAEERERAAHESALRAIGLCLEARDAETQGHTDRVTDLAVRLGEHLGLNDTGLRTLRWGAYLHDIGKIGIPDDILHHPGGLSAEMRGRMQEHVGDGVRLATQLSFLPQATLDVIGAHHEWWDGRGYPAGLKGEEIALPARIFSVCDVFDALTNARPYKAAWSMGATLEYIQDLSGQQFDPQVVEALLAVLGDELPAVM